MYFILTFLMAAAATFCFLVDREIREYRLPLTASACAAGVTLAIALYALDLTSRQASLFVASLVPALVLCVPYRLRLLLAGQPVDLGATDAGRRFERDLRLLTRIGGLSAVTGMLVAALVYLVSASYILPIVVMMLWIVVVMVAAWIVIRRF